MSTSVLVDTETIERGKNASVRITMHVDVSRFARHFLLQLHLDQGLTMFVADDIADEYQLRRIFGVPNGEIRKRLDRMMGFDTRQNLADEKTRVR